MCYCLCLPLPLYRVVMKLRGRQFTPDGTHLFATHNRSHWESGEPENYKSNQVSVRRGQLHFRIFPGSMNDHDEERESGREKSV